MGRRIDQPAIRIDKSSGATFRAHLASLQPRAKALGYGL
jgi:hypothetical protein